MAQIKESFERNMTREEADAFIRNAEGRVRFFISTTVHLPIEDQPGRVFPSYCFLQVSKAQARQFVARCLGEVLQGRGARITIKAEAPNEDSITNLAFVWIG